MNNFIIVTDASHGAITVTEKQANNLDELIEKISKTQRSKMEYKIFSSRPFNFETLLYTNRVITKD